MSTKGALLSAKRTVKKRMLLSEFIEGGSAAVAAYNPNALPMYKQDFESMQPGRKKVRRVDRHDAAETQKPQPPTNGPGANGVVGKNYNITQYVMARANDDYKHLMADPRKELLKYNESSKGAPDLFGNAYAKTQPQTLLAAQTFEEEIREEAEALGQSGPTETKRVEDYAGRTATNQFGHVDTSQLESIEQAKRAQ